MVNYEITSLKKPLYNQRLIVDSRLDQLIKSLKTYGFVGGIFINSETNHVIDGWQRCEQWRDMGNDLIPCYLVSCTTEFEKRLHLHLNQQVAMFNLEDFGLSFEGINLLDFGFSETDLATTIQQPIIPKEIDQKPQIDGFTKLMARVKVSTMDKLKKMKLDQNLATTGDVLDYLLENYENN